LVQSSADAFAGDRDGDVDAEHAGRTAAGSGWAAIALRRIRASTAGLFRRVPPCHHLLQFVAAGPHQSGELTKDGREVA
jgi:hypothetical protein